MRLPPETGTCCTFLDCHSTVDGLPLADTSNALDKRLDDAGRRRARRASLASHDWELRIGGLARKTAYPQSLYHPSQDDHVTFSDALVREGD